MTTHSFSKFLYCDTNILSHLAKQPALWAWFADYLLGKDLTLAIGGQVAELADAKRLHQSLAKMFVSLPAGIIKSWDVVLAEEVAAHPQERGDTLLMYPINALLLENDGMHKVEAFLSSAGLGEARLGQRRSAELLAARHAELKPNFPPAGAGGKYVRSQAVEFAWIQALQWLSTSHLDFLRQFKGDVAGLNAATFRSVRLFALVLFYKYYLGGREPRRASDFGDLSHLYAIPYCSETIVERDLANTLRQIQRHDNVLVSTAIYDIDFFAAPIASDINTG